MIPGLNIQIVNRMENLLANDDAGTMVTLHWRVVAGRNPAAHVDDESAAVDLTVTAGSMELRAFVHTVAPRMSGFQKFVEVQAGDVILDYLGDLDLAGKEDLRVEIAGRFFVQKNASKELLETWDAMTGNGGLLKTLLFAPAK